MAMKSTKVEKIKRVAKIQEMIIDGNSRYEMVCFGKENWQVAPRTVDWYIKAARKNIEQKMDELCKDALAQHYALRVELLRMAMDENKLFTALQIGKDMAKLIGLYHPQKIQRLRLNYKGLTKEQAELLLDGWILPALIFLDPKTGELVFLERNQTPIPIEALVDSSKNPPQEPRSLGLPGSIE